MNEQNEERTPAPRPEPRAPRTAPRPGKSAQRYAKKRRARKLRVALLGLVAAVLLVAVVVMGVYALQMNKARREFEDLSVTVNSSASASTAPQMNIMTTPPIQLGLPTEASVPAATAPKVMLEKYSEIYKQNSDLYGWLTIEDTRIDYPVMHSPQDPEKYLHANFNAEYSYAGTPFLDAACSPDSDNLIIYAHNMLDGSMFRGLLKFEGKDYWEKHPTIQFNTLYEEQEFEILAAFYDRVYYQTEKVFKFYQFIDAKDEADFDEAVRQFKEKSLYDTGVDAEYGDQLLTLVTCAYHTENGRFVVVARRK